MKSRDELRSLIKQHQSLLAERYGVEVVGLFGSYAREEPKQGSDVDLLVEILRPVSLFELIGAEIYLGQILGVKVDLIPKRDVRVELSSLFRKFGDVFSNIGLTAHSSEKSPLPPFNQRGDIFPLPFVKGGVEGFQGPF